jgi:crotonobetaine/carnitine-CoA ligase
MMAINSEPNKPDDADNPVRLVISAGTPHAIWESFEKRFNVKIHEW